MVLVLTALVASLVGVALRDSAESSLEQEAQRLSALLEGARAESRTAGVPVRFEIGTPGGDRDFRFLGWPGREPPPQRWLHPEVRAEIVGAAFLVLGPEPLIGAQRVRLWLADRQVVLATDGLGPFAVQGSATP